MSTCAGRVAVVGGGIIGVSSALRLLETVPGVQVTLIAEKLSPNTTGDGSAGFWNPYLLGGTPLEDIRDSSAKTFDFLLDIQKSATASDYGVGLLSTYHLDHKPIVTPPYADIFIEYRPLEVKELAMFPSKYRYGVFFTTLYAECKKLIPMLMKRFHSRGGKVIQKRLKSLEELVGQFELVINCPGVEAAQLVKDTSVTPIRGQVTRVRAPWIKHAFIGGDDYYILPNTDEVICGGTHQEGNWSREVDPGDSDNIWKGCTEIVPSLKNATIIQEWVGLRPGRTKLRIERETLNTRKGKLEVVHNYGHGGSGVTIFWGCAEQAVTLAQEALIQGKAPSTRAKL